METTTPTNPMIAPPVEADNSEVTEAPVANGNGGSYDQAPPEEPKAQEAPQQEEDVVDVLVPKASSVRWEIGPDGARRAYVQRPLSFIAKMQWFSLVGEVLDKALSGEGGMSLNSLFSAPGRPGELTMADFRDADTFVQAISKLLSAAPDFLVKSYCIWLAVPDYERDLVAELMALPPDEGGLTDEQGIEIIEVFIDQNYEALDRFFRDLVGRLGKRVQKRAEAAQSSRQSKP